MLGAKLFKTRKNGPLLPCPPAWMHEQSAAYTWREDYSATKGSEAGTLLTMTESWTYHAMCETPDTQGHRV